MYSRLKSGQHVLILQDRRAEVRRDRIFPGQRATFLEYVPEAYCVRWPDKKYKTYLSIESVWALEAITNCISVDALHKQVAEELGIALPVPAGYQEQFARRVKEIERSRLVWFPIKTELFQCGAVLIKGSECAWTPAIEEISQFEPKNFEIRALKKMA